MSDGQADRHPLDRLLLPILPAGDTGAVIEHGGEPPVWLRADDWRIFASAAAGNSSNDMHSFARFEVDGGGAVDVRLDSKGRCVHVPFDLADAYRAYVREQWLAASLNRRLSTQQLDMF
ncbi:MAG: hypothetical protein ACXVRS_14925 [Gaiellaceae bacterium]